MNEMYIESISTRKVTKIQEEKCGPGTVITQVSQATASLDEELANLTELSNKELKKRIRVI